MYFYNGVNYPGDVQVLQRIESAAARLHKKLIKIDLDKICISEYNQRYLGNMIFNIVKRLKRYTHLIALALADSKVPLEEFVLIDYGGGNGILSFLANELNVGRVIYNDIYKVSCDDVRKISQELNMNNIKDYICGDIDDTISYLRKESLVINAIVSSDVIEHIYNIEDYLRKLKYLSDHHFRIVFSTGSPKNPLLTRKIKKDHLAIEKYNREPQWGHKDRDTLRSYLDIRREIISTYAPTLKSGEIEKLAILTRGLISHDIEKYIEEYKIKGDISYRPNHPTNTCDPYTGNWAEHLMDIRWLENILRDDGFTVRILGGYWGSSTMNYKMIVEYFLNTLINLFGRKALYISPDFIIYADYNPINS